MPKNTNLVPLPTNGPENLFEKVVNHHHDEVKAAENQKRRQKQERIVTRWLIAAFLAGLAIAYYVGFLLGSGLAAA